MTEVLHTYPVADIVDHDTENFDECICGPDVVFFDNGNKQVIHHSLDGREHDEPDHDKADCPLCSVTPRPIR